MTTITIPSFETAQGWSVTDVRNFLESNNDYFSLNNIELGNIENSRFNSQISNRIELKVIYRF